MLNGIDPKYFDPKSRFGGGFYVTQKGDTAVAELAVHNVEATHVIRYETNLTNQKVLGLTNKTNAKQWGLQQVHQHKPVKISLLKQECKGIM